MRHVATGDRNAYDRCIFHVMDHPGRALLILGLGVYPNTGVIDAYATLRLGDTLHAVRASDALGDDRMALTVGPLGITVDKPLQRLRLTCAADPDDPDGLVVRPHVDRGFPATWEPHHPSAAATASCSKAAASCRRAPCAGTIRVGGEEIAVTPAEWTGTRDRSWGVRPLPGEDGGRAAEEHRDRGLPLALVPGALRGPVPDGHRPGGRRRPPHAERGDRSSVTGTATANSAGRRPRSPTGPAPGTPSAPSSTSATVRKPPELGVEILTSSPARRRRRLPARRRLAARHLAGAGLDRPPHLRPLRPRRPPARRLRRHRPRGPLHPRRPGRARHLRARLLRAARPERLHRLRLRGPAATQERCRDGQEWQRWPRHPVPVRPPATPKSSPAASPPGSAPGCPAPRRSSVTVPDSNGMSSETLLFDIEHPEPPVRACALRLAADPAAYTVFPVLRHAAPVPHHAPGGRAHGPARPAGAMAGGGPGAPRGALLRHGARRRAAYRRTSCPTRTRATGCTRPATPSGSTSRRASSRTPRPAARPSPVRGGRLPRPPGQGNALRRHVEAQRAYYAWVVDGLAPLTADRATRSTGSRNSGPRPGRDGAQLGRRPHRQRRLRRVRTRGRPRLGDGGTRPRARSTSAGWCICTASSRTSPSPSASADCRTSCAATRRGPLRRTHRAHAPRHGLPHPVRRPAARHRHAAGRLPAGLTSARWPSRRTRTR